MPELPEVETVVRGLRDEIVGHGFESITAEYEPCIYPGVNGFARAEGAKVLSVERRGKFINIFMERDLVLTIHLRMSGRLIVQKIDDEPLKFERTRLDFDGNKSLRFCDMRKFGRVWLCGLKDYEEITGIHRLGVEPLSEEFNLEQFAGFFEGRQGAVKKFLLDQSLMAGVGNIYADEACFYAGVRPDRDVSTLEEAELQKLFEGVQVALHQGIRNKGTSISDYADAYGQSGSNQELLFVYGRGGRNCLNCETVLEKFRCAGRGTVVCSGCQV